MRVLVACEFYAPSVGGVQEVMRQVAERLVLRGHEVTVATTRQADRDFEVLNGVTIRGFEVSGNRVRGLSGEVEAYRRFVLDGGFDAVLIKAAQQWTFDALWPVLDRLSARKVFIPCGFSGLYDPAYARYFEEMPGILARFDKLIFYATHYRDIDFARRHGLEHRVVIPNGADEREFAQAEPSGFRARHGLAPDEFVCLTIGSYTGRKGHLEVLEAFERMPLDRPATLFLNGNTIHRAAPGWKDKLKALVRGTVWPSLGMRHLRACRRLAARINRSPNKRVRLVSFERRELVEALVAADLFVFASQVEYSPLVLFEAVAAGTPFLSGPVGNAEEIAAWTGGGVIAPATIDAQGLTHVEIDRFAALMAGLAQDPERLREIGENGRQNWLERFTWDKIVEQYEQTLM